MSHEKPRVGVPSDWDRIAERSAEADPTPAPGPSSEPVGPPSLAIAASSWGEAVAVLLVCAGALAAVYALGHPVGLTTLAWAAVAAVAWWSLTSTLLLAVRHGTAGMLMAGVAFAAPVSLRRAPAVLAVAAVSALLLGLPGLLGARRHPLTAVAGAALVPLATLEAGHPPVVKGDV